MKKGLIVTFALVFGITVPLLCKGKKTKYPFMNPDLPLSKRVDDLVSRLTLDEKISQMMHAADSIPRLGIPNYNWWSEGLHGVGRAGIATVFPQAIGMAAMWNDELMLNIADVISTEFRAKFNDYQKKGERDIYKGLTVWSPNINIFRDPRWGRGQETYGEDPCLTSRMGVAFVKGLQGNDPKYFKVISTPKHYAVHSGPEPLRHTFDAETNYRDFAETYTPAFRATIVDAGAYSIMGAYQKYLGVPCNASDLLLKKTLREKWGFMGYVTSDCGAINDIFETHKYVKTPAEAAAVAVLAGCDLECGDYYKHLKEAVQKGLLSEKDIDVSVKRLFTARMKLGLFDPQEMVKYAQIPITENDSKEHKELALKAARESIVLLKNNGALPLKKEIKTLAVIGPNADKVDVLYGNYNGFASNPVTILQGIKNKLGENTRIIYLKGCGLTSLDPDLEIVPEENLSVDGQPGLKGEYFANMNMDGTPAGVRIDKKIDFDFSSVSPINGLKTEKYSVRWTGKLKINKTGEYHLGISGDDGYRLYIDNKLTIDAWRDQFTTLTKAVVHFNEGETHDIKIEYYQNTGGAVIRFHWGISDENLMEKTVEAAKQADAIVFAGGISADLEGEEMPVSVEGFKGGDRTTLDLPAIQTEFLKALKNTGKPVILVLLNGSALSVNWEDENLDAIVEAWYPGQAGGNAVADVIWGDYNPAGRLPVTFYKSVNDLPPFEDYNMNGRTYRYFSGKPLYEFGYGLSYTTFSYSNISAPENISTNEELKLAADVENTGKIDGDEVVQLYVRFPESKIPVPVHALKEFKRIHLKAGEKKRVEFTLKPYQLSKIDDDNRRIVEAGKLQIFIGSRQPDESLISKEMMVRSDINIKGQTNVIE